ncbi:MAG: flagellar biosynthesis protein FlhB [Clostridiales bacterium]|nr:flagellar biosynthesis protein FlhB [Clostridiales bacterium]
MNQGGGEKTEKATPKKRREARERGQVLRSTELNTAFCCLVMFGFLLLYWPTFMEQMAGVLRGYLGAAVQSGQGGVFDTRAVGRLFLNVLLSFCRLVLPIFGLSILAGLLVNLLQVGTLFTTKTLEPKLERISLVKGFARIFSTRTLFELAKSMLKVVVLGYVLYQEYRKRLFTFPAMVGQALGPGLLAVMNTAFSVALRMSMALAVLAALDFLYQWWKYEHDLMMSKQEVKEEYKLTEGDPKIKGRIRQKQREMSAMRMMDQVPTADVVITNPTHYAIALRYREGIDSAPVVVAKGKDFLARKIKERAREHRIELVEDRALAQALYQVCEPGSEIPAEFYQAVADILVFIYRQKNRIRREAQ